MSEPLNLGVPTREVFGNITPWMRVAFYSLMTLSLGVLGYRFWARGRLWFKGVPGGFERDWRLWFRRISVFALAQKRVHKKTLGAFLHMLLFSGFVVLTIGTTLLMISHAGPVDFHYGWYYLFYELSMEVFGVAFCAGCVLAIGRRIFRRPTSLGHGARDVPFLVLLLALGLTGFALEALRLRYTLVPTAVAQWSIVAHGLNVALLQQLPLEAARGFHLAAWWVHAFLVGLFFATLPVSRMLHVITAPLNIATRPTRHAGALRLLREEEMEASGRIGNSFVTDFNQQQLLSLDACMECGRCETACPAWHSHKPLSPRKLIVDLQRAMGEKTNEDTSLHGTTISADTLWACTMCQACVYECPVLIGHVDIVSDMRRFLVAEGQISGPPAKAMQNLPNRYNPYGRPNPERMNWAAGLNVPTVESNPNFEYLYWVGCAAAFDPRAQKVARDFVRLLTAAGVNFAVLGTKERCTGDVARRLGDEFLYQDLAKQNITNLNGCRAKKIVTACPHCFNTLRNEYPQLGGHYDVQHHSQMLQSLLDQGQLSVNTQSSQAVTLHDPCYLARVNEETTAPRAVLKAADSRLHEMPRNGTKTFCCGAGGGRMWFDEPREQRVSMIRASEALSTGAQRIATACPFCLNMMSDAVATANQGAAVDVLDIAELLASKIAAPESEPPSTCQAVETKVE